MGELRSCMPSSVAIFFFKKKEGQKKCVGKGDQGRPTWSSAKGFHGKDFKCEEGKE